MATLFIVNTLRFCNWQATAGRPLHCSLILQNHHCILIFCLSLSVSHFGSVQSSVWKTCSLFVHTVLVIRWSAGALHALNCLIYLPGRSGYLTIRTKKVWDRGVTNPWLCVPSKHTLNCYGNCKLNEWVVHRGGNVGWVGRYHGRKDFCFERNNSNLKVYIKFKA